MESHRCASAASDHSEGVAGSCEQHCSQMPQQMIFNAASQGHPHHLSGHNHMPPQQNHMVVPQQQYISAEPNIHSGPADLPTGEVPLHGQLMSPVQPNAQMYSETKSHYRHSSSHEQAAAVYRNMSGPVMSMPGHVFRSPNAMHQNLEGMVVTGHLPGEDGHMSHGGYYPMPPHGQHMQNSGQISWHSQRQYMSPGGQGNVPGQVYVSGTQVRFNSQMSVPFRAQHPRYVLNQEYGDVYCQQYHPVYGELNSGSPRGTFSPQQHCIGPNGQRIMFARPSMHASHHQPHMPADARFVYYTPHKGNGPSQQLSPSWSGSAQVMRSGIPVGYGNQPAWQQPMPVAYGSPLPGQRIPGYHLSPEPRTNPELCDNLGGARQHSSPSQSFSPGLVRCHRPSSNQEVHTGMVNADDKCIGTCHVSADENCNSTPASQDYISPAVASTVVSTAVCTTVSNTSSKNNHVVTPTTTPSHPLEHLPDGRTSLPHCTRVICADGPNLSVFNHPSYYGHETNVNVSWSVSCSGEYYSYPAASQYTQHQHTGRHVNPYNCYVSHPHVPYAGISHYPMTRCGHPNQTHTEGMQWQGQVAEHPLHECRNTVPNDVASQHHLKQESLTPVAITTCCETSAVAAVVAVSSSACSVSAPVLSGKSDMQNFSDADKVLVARFIPLQSTASNVSSQLPFSGSAYPAVSSPVATSLNYNVVSQVVVTATSIPETLPSSSLDSVHVASSKDTEMPSAIKDILFVQDKNTENVVAVSRQEMELQNSLQVTSDALSSTCKSSKAPKRSRSRKATTKTKKKKTNLPLDTGEFCSDSAVVTCTDTVKCTAVESLCSLSSTVHTVSPLKLMPGTESVDSMCPLTSSSSEQAAVIVPYGWQRHVDDNTVVYYR